MGTSHPAHHPSCTPEFLSLRKEIHHKQDHFLYFTAMVLLLLANLVSVLVLIPVFVLFRGIELYFIITVFGILSGFLFNLLIHSIEHLGDKHHLIAGIVIPLLSAFDIFLLLRLIERITQLFAFSVVYNPWVIVALFIGSFIVPYFFDVVRGKHRF